MEYDKTKCQGNLLKGYTGCMCDYCRSFSAIKSKWIACIKPWAGRNYEIAIARETNRHAFSSYGWFGENKIYISSASSHNYAEREIYDLLVNFAINLANKKNIEEGLI